MAGDDQVAEFDVSALVRELDGYEQRLKNLPLDVFGMLLVAKVDEMFQSEGAAGSEGPWEPLSPATLKRHPHRRGGLLLQDTGATAAGVHSDERGMDVFLIASTAQSRFILDGTEHMPARDFFALNFPRVLDELGELVLEELA